MNNTRAILVMGQKKGGTTSLYSAIQSSGLPIWDIPKESGILNSSATTFGFAARKGVGRVLLDGTTTYFSERSFSEAFRSNVAAFDHVTVLLTVRPEEVRMVSHYQHSLNFDGWRGSLTEFASSAEYLAHAELSQLIDALAALGISDIRWISFEDLSDPTRQQTAVQSLTGVDALSSAGSAQNQFGSRPVLPGWVQAIVAAPIFQVILRPLVPTALRQRIKRMMGRGAVPVSADPAEIQSVADIARRIDRENAQALTRLVRL